MLIEELKKEMMEVFEMTDLGEMSFFLEREIKQIPRSNIHLSQEACKRNSEEI